jgi:CheY-like chemotaxis protein
MRGHTTCRVLFVEDEAMVSILIEDMLLDLGVEVVGPAARMDEALALAREADVEAALLDINVGGQFTYEVADILRGRGIPVIFSTGYGASALPDRFPHEPDPAQALRPGQLQDRRRGGLVGQPLRNRHGVTSRPRRVRDGGSRRLIVLKRREVIGSRGP